MTQRVVLSEEEKLAAEDLLKARREWEGDVADPALEQANHDAYNRLWIIANNKEERVVAMLRYIGLYTREEKERGRRERR